MRFLKTKRFWLCILLLSLFTLLTSCAGTRTLMMTTPNTPKGAPASPALEYDSQGAWESARPAIIDKFEREIYGRAPMATSVSAAARKTLDNNAYNGSGQIEELTVNFTPDYRGEADIAPEQSFQMVVITPNNINGPVPVIMTQNFCPNHDVAGKDSISKPDGPYYSCGGDGIMSRLMHYFFGRYIVSPPIEEIMNRGYALAIVHPPAWVADNPERAMAKLKADMPQTYTIAAWATQFEAMGKVFEDDARFSAQIAWGHSRYGKSALLATAFSRSIDGVIAHQSGTGGASLSKHKKGETVAQITENYPHWFAPSYKEDILTIDQHQLLALIAPKPIMLGNAKRDVWSDPEGAFRAAQGASPIYELYGKNGLSQTRLKDFTPEADIAFWIRPGTHGVVKEDWPAFLDFLDAHFKEAKNKRQQWRS